MLGSKTHGWWAALFAVILLAAMVERGLPHHCSSEGLQDQHQAADEPALTGVCPLCDVLAPAFIRATGPAPIGTPCVIGETIAEFSARPAVGHRIFLPLRGPPLAQAS